MGNHNRRFHPTDINPILECVDVSKRFGPIVANENISLELYPGRIHVLLGENGAGKSTLMNIMMGYYKPDRGTLQINGRPIQLKSPTDALRSGIYMIPQSFALIPEFSILENLALTPRIRSGFMLHMKQARKAISESGVILPEEDLVVPVKNLSLAAQQKVELTKATCQEAKALLMDEPTSLLTPSEVDELFSLLRSKVRQGLAVLISTHKIDEVLSTSDKVYVLRRGRMVAQYDSATKTDLVRALTGDDWTPRNTDPPVHLQEPIVRVQNLCTEGTVKSSVKNVSFEIGKGEIVGLAGEAGHGQKTLDDALGGLLKRTKGMIHIDGYPLGGMSRKAFLDIVGYVPENPLSAVNPEFTIERNFMLDNYNSYFRRGLLTKSNLQGKADKLISRFRIEPPKRDILVKYLSGGNIQKVVVAREISKQPKLLIAHNITRGLDIRTTHLVHEEIRNLAAMGGGILFASEDLDELSQQCTRVLVLEKGSITLELRGEINARRIAEAIAG